MSAGEKQDQEGQPQAEAQATESLLESAITATKQTERSRAEELIRTLTEEAMKGTVTFDKDVTRTLKAGIQAIDSAVSRQLAAVMHRPEFQQLEAGSPHAEILVLYGSALGKSLIGECPEAVVDIAAPRSVVLHADGAGRATVRVYIPDDASGERLFFQAVDLASCDVTNLIVRTMD